MRIVINGLFLVPNRVGGSETYLRGLIDGLAQVDVHNTYVLCVGAEAVTTFKPPNERWQIVAGPARSARRPLRLPSSCSGQAAAAQLPLPQSSAHGRVSDEAFAQSVWPVPDC